jgi:hypothetical protein
MHHNIKNSYASPNQEFKTKHYNHYCNFEGEERTYHQMSSSLLRVRRAVQGVEGSR